MKRTPMKRKRATPRRRTAPQWSGEEWGAANPLLVDRAGLRCEICQTDWGPFHRHHRQRRRDGGDRLSNLLYICETCHRFAHEHPKQARRWGYIVSAYVSDPSVVPVLWRRKEWMVLGDDGSLLPWPDDLQDAHDVKIESGATRLE